MHTSVVRKIKYYFFTCVQCTEPWFEKSNVILKKMSNAHSPHYLGMSYYVNFLGGLGHRQENRRLVGHFYDMKNRFWAVGCGLGWAVE
jgi:hypothetical protein